MSSRLVIANLPFLDLRDDRQLIEVVRGVCINVGTY